MVWAFACDDGPQPPVACASIPAQTTYVGQKTLVEPWFEDPEMGLLTLAAVSSNPGVATAEVLGDKVQFVAVAPGTAAITVTATDPDGLSGELTFEALVPNQPPQRREDHHGDVVEIPAFFLEVGGPEAERVLSEYFADPDGQELGYGATSSDTRREELELPGGEHPLDGDDVPSRQPRGRHTPLRGVGNQQDGSRSAVQRDCKSSWKMCRQSGSGPVLRR